MTSARRGDHSPPALAVHSLTHRYVMGSPPEKLTVLSSIDLDIARGQFACIITRQRCRRWTTGART